MADYSLHYTGNQMDQVGGLLNENLNNLTDHRKVTDTNKNTARGNINAASSDTTINEVPLGTSAKTITLTGANINVSGSDSTKIDVALGAKVPTSRTINGKALTSNITINAEEIPYSNSLIAAINTVKDALDTALGGISKIFFVDEDRNIDYDLSIEDGYFYINLVS